MEHGEDVAFFFAYAIHNPVTAKENFADVLLANFWHNTP